MDLRPYQSSDRAGCLQVFDSNAPSAFHPDERDSFAAFLDAPGSYFVLDHDGAIAGCGGFTSNSDGLAALTWIMVRKDLHGNGLGRLLVFSAMRKLTADADPMLVRLTTVPQSTGFFLKQGFREETVDRGRIGMVKKLKVCP